MDLKTQQLNEKKKYIFAKFTSRHLCIMDAYTLNQQKDFFLFFFCSAIQKSATAAEAATIIHLRVFLFLRSVNLLKFQVNSSAWQMVKWS